MYRQRQALAGSLLGDRQFQTGSVLGQRVQTVVGDRVVHARTYLPLLTQGLLQLVTLAGASTLETDGVLVVDVTVALGHEGGNYALDPGQALV